VDLVAVVDFLAVVAFPVVVVVEEVGHLAKACVHQGGTWQGCQGLRRTSTRRVLQWQIDPWFVLFDKTFYNLQHLY